MTARIASAYCVHDDHWFLESAIRSFLPGSEPVAFVSRVAWDGSQGDWERAAGIAEQAGAQVVLGDWASENEHRRAALEILRERGYTHAFTTDGDEVVEPALLRTMCRIAENDLADRIAVFWDTYWRDANHVVRPREAFCPTMMVRLDRVCLVNNRQYDGGRPMLLYPEHGIVHHLSYAGPDERILRKIRSWGHRDEVVAGWWERVWLPWEGDRLMRNLHPTHPSSYGAIEPIPTPEILSEVPSYRPAEPVAEVPLPRGRVSVVIPLHGGAEEIGRCLASLEGCRDFLHETIVVDDASPDRAAEVPEAMAWVRTIRLGENRGFAGACNEGYRASEGDLVVFLNSDTVVPRLGLLRLIETLESSGVVGAAGPCTNACIGGQIVSPTYGSLDHLDAFAGEFARRRVADTDTDFLVGFCVAVRRSVVEEVGGAFDERFGIGTFEDNDLSYRILRAGYRLVVSRRAYVHHEGSATFRREEIACEPLLARNLAKYREKWREDLELGFATELSGLGSEPVRFRADRRPDRVHAQIEELARRADVSLCMIVKDEERVLGQCLESSRGFFSQTVVVDTGSSDRSREIAASFGAETFDFPWTQSFSDARNESLRHARGRWVFWMDADDTLPLAAGEELLRLAANAPEDVGGFVVPVQFVEDGPGGGTRVDHVKLFRNLPGLRFEGRIHEQILPSLRARGLKIARSQAVVLHSGYDTSEAGQARKRARDWSLLELELRERPEHPFVLFNCGMTAQYCGRHEEALGYLQRSIAVCDARGDAHVRKAFALRSEALRDLGREDEAIDAALEALGRLGPDPELHFLCGTLMSRRGRLEEALAQYRAVGAPSSEHFASFDSGILGHKLWHNMAVVLAQLGRYPEARDLLLKACLGPAFHRPSVGALYEQALENGDLRTAHQALDILRQAEGLSEAWADMAMRLRNLAEGPGAGERFLTRICADRPAEAGPSLAWARARMACGDREAAVERLRDLVARGVPAAAYYLGMEAEERGNLGEATAWFARSSALDPANPAPRAKLSALAGATPC